MMLLLCFSKYSLILQSSSPTSQISSVSPSVLGTSLCFSLLRSSLLLFFPPSQNSEVLTPPLLFFTDSLLIFRTRFLPFDPFNGEKLLLAYLFAISGATLVVSSSTSLLVFSAKMIELRLNLKWNCLLGLFSTLKV